MSNLLESYNVVYKRFEKREHTDIIYIDFCKAFDSIDQNILINKLINICPSMSIIKILQLLLTKNFQVVKFGDKLFNKLPISSGVPQGSILSPLLFNLYINEIFNLRLNNIIIGYADDIKLIGEPGVLMQSDIDTI